MSEQNSPAETLPQSPTPATAPTAPQTAPIASPATPQPSAPPQEPSTPQQPAPQPPAAPEQPATQEQPATPQQGPALGWTSGDFQEDPGTDPPYNGLQLTAVPAYSEQSLVSVAVTILDFTYSQTGVPVTIQLEPATAGKRTAVQPPSATAPQFTVRGTLELRSMPTSLNPVLFLFIDLYYGLADEQHHAEGGILEIPQVLDLSSLPAAGPSQGGGVPASTGGSTANGGSATGGSSPATTGTSYSPSSTAEATTPTTAPPDVATALQAVNASLDRIAGALEKLAGSASAGDASDSVTPSQPPASSAPDTGNSQATTP